MVLVCRSPILDEPHFKPALARGTLWERVVQRLPDLDPPRDRHYAVRWLIRISTASGALVVLMYIILSETQISRNQVLSGENEFWTFSQVSFF